MTATSTGLQALHERRDAATLAAFGLLLTAASLGAFALGGLRNGATLAGLLITPLCLMVIGPFALWLIRVEDRHPSLGSVLVLGMGIKLFSTLLRFEMVRTVYGSGDSNEYHRWADEAQPAIRSLNWGALNVDAPLPGTGFIRILTGGLYAIIGVDQFGGFLAFSTMSFAAAMIFYRAFTVGIPDGDRRLFALLVFCWPSWVFWPSSIGKDAWMVLSLSVAALGAAHIARSFRRGYPTLIVGVVMATMVRPHIAGLIVAAVAGALLLSAFRGGNDTDGRFKASRFVALAVVLGIGVLVSGRIMTLFGIDEFSTQSVNATFDETVRLTSQGGSSFAAQPVRTPLDIPGAVVTVLLRPLPHEIPNAAAAIASIEGLMLMAIIALRWQHVRQLPRRLADHPYASIAGLYVLLFCVAFSAIGNFGILSRQRVQVYPLLFVLLCLPTITATAASATRASRRPTLPTRSLS